MFMTSLSLASTSTQITRHSLSHACRMSFSTSSKSFQTSDEKLQKKLKKKIKSAVKSDSAASASSSLNSNAQSSFMQNDSLSFQEKSNMFKKQQVALRETAQKQFMAAQERAKKIRALNAFRPIVKRYPNVEQKPLFYDQMDATKPIPEKLPSQEDMRSMVSIYHSAQNFITLDNLESAIDNVFAGPNLATTIGSKNLDVVQLYNTLKPEFTHDPELLSDPIAMGLVADPERIARQKATFEYMGTPTTVDSANIRLADQRLIQIRDALYGTSDNLKIGFDNVADDLELKRLEKTPIPTHLSKIQRFKDMRSAGELHSFKICQNYASTKLAKWKQDRAQKAADLLEEQRRERKRMMTSSL